jgi:predicted RNA binding protein YcfA (HicA-like mRNA interferase family)
MARVGPLSRRELITNLRQLGFSGPYPGGRHELMVRGTQHVVLPNPHEGDIGRHFLLRILREAGISREEWEAL